jgi:hypothetical protein
LVWRTLLWLLLPALATLAAAQNSAPSFLAYVRVIDVDVTRNDGFDACLIVGTDGQFRFELEPPAGSRASTTVYRGHLVRNKYEEFESLVQAPELRELRSSQPRGSLLAARWRETVSLRILRHGETQETVVTTVDDRNPMPPAMHAFLPWMKALPKTLGRPDRRARARNCSALDLTSGFSPELQKR